MIFEISSFGAATMPFFSRSARVMRFASSLSFEPVASCSRFSMPFSIISSVMT